jgi:hypothetical protein
MLYVVRSNYPLRARIERAEKNSLCLIWPSYGGRYSIFYLLFEGGSLTMLACISG